jgi:hydroxyacid-oxoacid transhydrogenase
LKKRSASVAADPNSTDYAFEMAASSIRFGAGATAEVGMDVKNIGAKKVIVVTDKNVAQLQGMTTILQALEQEGIAAEVWDQTRVEPKDVR